MRGPKSVEVGQKGGFKVRGGAKFQSAASNTRGSQLRLRRRVEMAVEEAKDEVSQRGLDKSSQERLKGRKVGRSRRGEEKKKKWWTYQGLGKGHVASCKVRFDGIKAVSTLNQTKEHTLRSSEEGEFR